MTGNTYTSTGSVPIDEWSHIVFQREGTTWTFYINGVPKGTGSDSTDITFTSIPTVIGYGGESFFAYFQGYMEEFRVTKGRALYNASFAVPTGPFTEFVPTLLIQSEHANGSTSFADSSSKHNVNPSSNINHITLI